LKIYISHGGYKATQLRCGGIFSKYFNTNFPRNKPVKNLISFKIWRRYGQNVRLTFLATL